MNDPNISNEYKRFHDEQKHYFTQRQRAQRQQHQIPEPILPPVVLVTEIKESKPVRNYFEPIEEGIRQTPATMRPDPIGPLGQPKPEQLSVLHQDIVTNLLVRTFIPRLGTYYMTRITYGQNEYGKKMVAINIPDWSHGQSFANELWGNKFIYFGSDEEFFNYFNESRSKTGLTLVYFAENILALGLSSTEMTIFVTVR